jgi:alpha-tubulin suppressor-like RCC1 family protein
MEGVNSLFLFGEFLGFRKTSGDGRGSPLQWKSEPTASVLDIAASSHTISIVLDDLTAYSVGCNDDGQLGIGSTDFASELTPVVSDALLVATTCATDFTFWITVDQLVVIAGKGFSDKPERFGDFRVEQICAYDSTVAIIEAQGATRLWPNFRRDLNTPIIVRPPSDPNEVSCGNSFACLRCGHSVFHISDGGIMSPLLCVGKYCDGLPSAVRVQCCADYSLVLDESGSVWLYGQIGDMVRKITNTPIAQDIRTVFALPGYCVFVNNLGFTYAMGRNECGQLADGTKMKRTRAVEACLLSPTTRVVGGRTFSVFLCSKFDTGWFVINMNEFVPGHMSCPFEKAEDLIDANSVV